MINKDPLAILINEHRPLLSAPELAPHDYHSLKTHIVQAELQKTIEDLETLLEIEGDAALKERFKALCATRAVENADSCLSFFAAPKDASNQLYWDFLIQLYEPGDLGEALAILAPNITALVMPEAYVKEKPAIGRNIGFHFKEVPIGELPKEPANLERLSSLVVSGKQLFDPRALTSLTFIQHQNLKERFDERFPELAEQTYKHNRSLKALRDDLETVSGDGQGLKRSLEILNRDLRLGGSHMTGAEFATLDAATAFTDFKAYLARLPEEMKAPFFALKGRDKTLRDVMQHLDRGDCVEIAAGYIKEIIDNPANQEFLSRHPHLSEASLTEIHKRYGKRTPLAIGSDDSTSKLPVVYLKKAMEKITISDVYDVLSLLISFNPDFYHNLFKYAHFHGDNRALFEHLSMRISEGVLNAEQTQALMKAVRANRVRFGSVLGLFFILQCGEDIGPLWPMLSPEEQLEALKAKDSFGNSMLHHAVRNSESLNVILKALPDDIIRLEAVKKKNSYGYRVLYYAAHNPESLKIILALYPEGEGLAAVKEKDRDGCTVLLLTVLYYPESLKVILKALPEGARLEAVKKDGRGNAVLHRAAGNPESLKIILALYPEGERLAVLKEKDRYGDTVLHRASGNPESLQKILEFLPEGERLEALNDKDEDGQSITERVKDEPFYREILSTCITKETLKAALEHYIDVRGADSRETFHLALLTFFGGGFTKTDELNAAQCLIELISGEEADIEPIHLRALKQGELGKIIGNWQAITGKNVEEEFVPAEMVSPNRCCLIR